MLRMVLSRLKADCEDTNQRYNLIVNPRFLNDSEYYEHLLIINLSEIIESLEIMYIFVPCI
jgi:hypothetical protein